jgi:hypothetical protein
LYNLTNIDGLLDASGGKHIQGHRQAASILDLAQAPKINDLQREFFLERPTEVLFRGLGSPVLVKKRHRIDPCDPAPRRFSDGIFLAWLDSGSPVSKNQTGLTKSTSWRIIFIHFASKATRACLLVREMLARRSEMRGNNNGAVSAEPFSKIVKS